MWNRSIMMHCGASHQGLATEISGPSRCSSSGKWERTQTGMGGCFSHICRWCYSFLPLLQLLPSGSVTALMTDAIGQWNNS